MSTSEKPNYDALPEIVTDQGEVLSAQDLAFAYSREGRRVIGKEYPSPIPMEPPLGFHQEKPLYEQIRDMVRRELSQDARQSGHETFEEADDFDVDDDFDPESPYEAVFAPTAPWPPSSPAIEAAEAAALTTKPEGPRPEDAKPSGSPEPVAKPLP